MMEDGYHDRPEAGKLSSLQRFEKIAAFELQVQSYRQNLLMFECKDFEIGNNRYRTNSRFELTEGVLEDFTQEPNDFYCEIEAMRENGSSLWKKGSNGDYSNDGVSTSIVCCSVNSSRSFVVSNLIDGSSLFEKKMGTDWRASSSNLGGKESQGCSESNVGGDSHKGKVGLPLSEVAQLRMRLHILEEDNQNMKKELFGNMEERRELLNEISQQLQIIHQHPRNRVIGEKSLVGSLMLNPNKDGSMVTGLSQALHQDSNPSLVTRILKANIYAFQDPTGVMKECSNR